MTMNDVLHVHVHFYTRDASWEESKHPRSKNGEFGSGSAGSAPAAHAKLTGNELGSYASMGELRKKAMEHAAQFIGKKFTNAATGHEIQVTKASIKHTMAGSGDTLIRTIPAIPALLRGAKRTSSVPDKNGASDIHAVETYEAPVEIGGKKFKAILTVKHFVDGRRLYDHGIVE